MSLCYVNICHKHFLFGGLLKVIVLYCIVLYCIVLYCIVLYCIVLYCIVLYCIVCTLKIENKQCYIMGDLNINLLNYDHHMETHD